MGFLDNSGNIILDAVLTDEGRRRLALGNGQFRISKFGLTFLFIIRLKYLLFYNLNIIKTI